MYSRILVDGSNIAHACNSIKRLTVGDFPTQAIFHGINSLASTLRKNRGAKMTVLWDGTPERRKAMYPEYKANRAEQEKNDPEVAQRRADLRAQLPLFKKTIQVMGVNQVVNEKEEADDIAAVLSRSLAARGESVLLVSGDKDWIGLVRPGVDWYDPIRDRMVTHETLFEKTGFMNPVAFYNGKALEGDTSDNIPGVPGFGEKTAREFIALHGSVAEFLAGVKAGTIVPKTRASKNAKTQHPEQYLASEEGIAHFNRNYALMNLLEVPNEAATGGVITKGELNPDSIQKICERLLFNSWLSVRSLVIGQFEEHAKL